jgi:hypothetical protein
MIDGVKLNSSEQQKLFEERLQEYMTNEDQREILPLLA